MYDKQECFRCSQPSFSKRYLSQWLKEGGVCGTVKGGIVGSKHRKARQVEAGPQKREKEL